MSDTIDILKKVRKIEIRTRGLTNQIFTGQYNSAFKGRGMAFSEVREYQYGDAIRDIDWNVTARLNHPYVKIFQEERELTVMLMVDVSASNLTGTGQTLKQQRITEIAAILAFSAIKNNDKVGVIFFSDIIEKVIPPAKGTQHILFIIRQLISFSPANRQTNIPAALRYLTNMVRKRCIVFLLSDFVDNDFEDAMRITNKKHDLLGIRVYDPMEMELPKAGLLRAFDAETGQQGWMDTSSERFRNAYASRQQQRSSDLIASCKRAGVDFTAISTHDDDYLQPLLRLFKRRGAQR